MASQLTRLLTVTEVADNTRLSVKTIRRATQDGRLRSVRWGRTVRVREEDLDDFLRAQTTGRHLAEDEEA